MKAPTEAFETIIQAYLDSYGSKKKGAEATAEIMREVAEAQREACANDISEESQDDPLIYSHTEAIRGIVSNTPLVTDK